MKKKKQLIKSRSMRYFSRFILVGVLIRLVFVLFIPMRVLVESDMFSTVIRDRKDEVIRMTLSADGKYRVHAKLANFPPVLIDAVLMKEDRYFYLHPGVNPGSLFLAARDTLLLRTSTRGASTITMQLVRLLYKLNTQTISGKLVQIIKAVQIELSYSKDEILEAYLNLVPCGYNIEGFQTASLVYFKKDVIDLTLSEALTLAVIPQNPNHRAPDPDTDNHDLISARNALYENWCLEHPQDRSSRLEFSLPARYEFSIPFYAPHYTDWLLKQKGLDHEISGTLDTRVQTMLEQLSSRFVARNGNIGIRNVSMLLMDYRSMEIRALIGSVDFFNVEIEGQVDGTNAKRSPGSTIKPLIYALAIEQGELHSSTMLKDAPADFSSYHPDNYDNEFEGPVKAADALNRSRNVPAVYVASLLSNPDLYEFLVQAGVEGLRDKSYYGLALVLGGAELTMRELVRLYAMLANGGENRLITGVCQDGNVSFVNERLLSPETCFLVLKMLEENPQTQAFLPGIKSETDHPVYWKTGTSLGFKDSWTIGIFDNYVLAVWVGNFNGEGNPAFTGSRAAAPIFFEVVSSLRKNDMTVPGSLTDYAHAPDCVTKIEVCELSGQLPQAYCPHRVWSWFIPGRSPIKFCDIHREIIVDNQTGYRTIEYIPGKTEKQVFEFWPSDLQTLFKKAGIPKKSPPGFDPQESIVITGSQGNPPEIVSPLSKICYVTRPMQNEYRVIPFIATADADAKKLFWFIDGRYAGESVPETALFWDAIPGTYTIQCVDDNGRSDSTTFQVISSD